MSRRSRVIYSLISLANCIHDMLPKFVYSDRFGIHRPFLLIMNQMFGTYSYTTHHDYPEGVQSLCFANEV